MNLLLDSIARAIAGRLQEPDTRFAEPPRGFRLWHPITCSAHADGMARQSETSTTSAELAERPDDERLIDESEIEIESELEVPLDAPIETPIEDALEQRRVEPLTDDEHDVL